MATGSKDVTFIGHSLGCTMMVASLVDHELKIREFLKNSVDKVYCLAPVVFMVSNLSLRLFRKISRVLC